MGLLDDAIREHLELKRRAGADAIDVARQEREALGPGGTADPLATPPDESRYAPPHDPPPAYAEPAPYADDERRPGAAPGPYDDAGPFDDDGPFDDEEYDEPHYAPQAPAPPAPAAPRPPPPVQAAPPPPPPAPPAGPPTEEYRVPPADAEPADVLEQTPDFLEETPEHDRLWFEQAPPREFDFDK